MEDKVIWQLRTALSDVKASNHIKLAAVEQLEHSENDEYALYKQCSSIHPKKPVPCTAESVGWHTAGFMLCLGCGPGWRGLLSRLALSTWSEPLRWTDMWLRKFLDVCLCTALGASDASIVLSSACAAQYS